jgi:hypothetical protein
VREAEQNESIRRELAWREVLKCVQYTPISTLDWRYASGRGTDASNNEYRILSSAGWKWWFHHEITDLETARELRSTRNIRNVIVNATTNNNVVSERGTEGVERGHEGHRWS